MNHLAPDRSAAVRRQIGPAPGRFWCDFGVTFGSAHPWLDFARAQRLQAVA